MEFFHNPNIDFLSKKWIFLALSLVFSVSGIISMAAWHGIPWGLEFRGGTQVEVKFTGAVDANTLRSKLDHANLHNARIQPFGAPANNEYLIALDIQETSEAALDKGKNTIISALESGQEQSGKQDLNNIGYPTLQSYLLAKDPLHLGTDASVKYSEIARAIVDFRDKSRGGVLNSINEVSSAAPAAVVQQLQADFFTSNFGVRNVQIIGPQVGSQLTHQAELATLYSLAGMLVYLWFRFEMIYGVAAVVACFHDTIITVGMFSILNREISLTVIAAILTLIGYSMNDTIVVFDRIRENVKLMRRESLTEIVNRSINQTLSRTVLTSGLTFLTVLSLYIFGGEVLRGFSLALVIGILIGTYSSIFIAAPMLVAYQDWQAKRAGNRATLPASRGEKARVKA